jgi:hypothetical protein
MAKAAPIIALLAGTAALVGLLGAQLGLFAPMTAFILFVAGSLLGGVLAVLAGLIGFFLSRGGRNPDGAKLAIAGIAAGLGLLLIVGLAASPGADLPPINDITTDLADPPAFAPSSIVPSYVGRDMSYPADFVPQVRAAYPDLAALETTESPRTVYERAIDLAEELGWEITARSDERMVFDAEDETSLFRFVDDVTLRVEPIAGGARVDMRSKSRDGRGDLGANAARIRDFLSRLEKSL